MASNMENSVTVNILIAALFLTTITEISMGIRIIDVSVPKAVESGKNAVLTCEYDTENEGLYSVKWYKGNREFFRFTPKEIPAEKVFRFPGLNVNLTQSNGSQVILENLTPKMTGRYTCEVSADAPSFTTVVGLADMEVVVLPTKDIEITGVKPYYQVSEILQANCTCNGSIPSALLEWKINNFPATSNDIVKYPIIKDPRTKLETRIVGLNFIVSPLYFMKGKMEIECTAKIHDLYQSQTSKSFEEDRPQVYSPSLSYLSEEEYNLRNAAAAPATKSSTSIAVALQLVPSIVLFSICVRTFAL